MKQYKTEHQTDYGNILTSFRTGKMTGVAYKV